MSKIELTKWEQAKLNARLTQSSKLDKARQEWNQELQKQMIERTDALGRPLGHKALKKIKQRAQRIIQFAPSPIKKV